MTRNLILASTLFAAAVLATGWALAPGCKGSFCLGKSFKTQAGQDRVGASEVPGTGRDLLGGNAQEIAPAAAPQAWLPAQDTQADTQTSWGGTELPEDSQDGAQDEAALTEEPEVTEDDWQEQPSAPARRAARNETLFDGTDGEELEPSLEQRRARKAAEAKAAKEWESLAEAALNEPDEELRGEAINSVGQQRSAESVAVLNQVAALDPSPDNRMQAIEQLWFSAGDGLDTDGMIRSTLETALDDPEESIAKMAEKALADLDALEQRRQEAEGLN